MKLKSVRIRNFKLLRDVRLDFSDDPRRPLTVIRAENGSGKTSTLVALRWALYGQAGLDNPSMRLSPTTWPDGQDCEVSVQIDFSHTLYSIIAGESVGTTTDYRLVRTATERPEGDQPNRMAARIVLYEFGEGGLEKREPPDRLVSDMLPPEMQNIFFTDGDSALTFISPHLTKASRRDQVREAIRSLLGLGLLEGAGLHVANVKKQYNREVSAAAGSAELTGITVKLAEAEDSLTRDTARLKDVERQIEDLARRYDEADKRLQAALQAGDHEELAQQQALARAQLSDAKTNEPALKRQHQQLIQDERLSLALLGPTLAGGWGELAKLHDAGVIPSGSVPVLQERLEMEVCICGTPLPRGSEARGHVEHLIDRQRGVDDKRKVLTELHHASKVDLQRASNAAADWLSELATLEHTRLNNRKAIAAATDQIRICQEKIERIDKAGINECRKDRDTLQAALTAKQDERRDLQTEIEKSQSSIDELTPQQAALRRKHQKLEMLDSRLTVTEDMAEVIRGALEDLQQVYLTKVSSRMNELFLQMVGADPATMAEFAGEANSRDASQIYTAAMISPNYEITVHSGDGRTLNPESDLNGASKRALTFSFIWALTEVSQVVAPRIIDTPLGMMSGLVKKRVLELITAVTPETPGPEKQVVLFLTRDEIRGIESVIDERAGRVMTFTNSDQYPIDVRNDPGVATAQILKCECSHRQFCQLCARRNDEQYALTERPII